jgi:hypothetical protein
MRLAIVTIVVVLAVTDTLAQSRQAQLVAALSDDVTEARLGLFRAVGASDGAGAKPQAAKGWVMPRTPGGRPDLQGTWDFRTATPLERPPEFGGREFLTPEDVAAVERRALERLQVHSPGDLLMNTPPWWLDFGTRVVPTRRSSLIVDPPDGRVPPMTPEAEKRRNDLWSKWARASAENGVEGLSSWERCITRGLPIAMLPIGYNNNLQLVQTPGYVVIMTEMIHEARIVPIDGRGYLPQNLRAWTGASRGRWEGDTLVVETTNFSDKSFFRGASENLRLIERFTRVDAGTIEYRLTFEDSTTWTSPWTVEFPLVKTDSPMYEYACHEGNYSLLHRLSMADESSGAAEQR